MSAAAGSTDRSGAAAGVESPLSDADGPRFAFGRNWAAFLKELDERRMAMARESLQRMLCIEDLKGRTFLDAGSGSGLFSLAAAQLGAETIVSFDYDPDSVQCTAELKRRFFPDLAGWTVTRGDCLDEAFLATLPAFDVVYSWGVLHHTGDMWRALDNVQQLVKPGGLLYVAIYNDQGHWSGIWQSIKRFYCRGAVQRAAVLGVFVPIFAGVGLLKDLARRKNPIARYREPQARGMSLVRDWQDWLGGYPFEVARPEEIFRFLRDRGFALGELSTTTGWGCNEFVFLRTERPAS